MPQTITLGPLAMATDRLLVMAAIWAFLLLMMLIGRRLRLDISRSAWIAILAGLIMARLGYIALNWSAFAGDWVAMLAFWQGGFELWSGVTAAALVLLLTLRDKQTLPRALMALAVCSIGSSAMQGLIQQPTRSLPFITGLQRPDGQAISLKRYRGKPFIINLWATWCPPCRRELPMLAEAAKTSSVPILLIDQGEDAERVRAFLADQDIAADAVLLDPGSSLSMRVGNGIFPTTLFVDRNGLIAGSHFGEISRATLQAQRVKLEKEDQ